jgi:uncharacterized protein
MIISLKVKPNSREDKITVENGFLVVRISAPAKDGKANDALIQFLADHWKIPSSKILIKSGLMSRFKRVSIPDEFKVRLPQEER